MKVTGNLQLPGVIVPKKTKVKILKINILNLIQNQKIFKQKFMIKEKSRLKFKIILKKIVMQMIKIFMMIKCLMFTLKGQIHPAILKIQKRKLVLLWYKILRKYIHLNELKRGLDRTLRNQKRNREEGGKVNLKIIIPFLKSPI